MRYRRPSTAPRDGTIVVGLFARPGRRAIALLASFVDDLDDHPMPDDAPAWMRDLDEARRVRRASDPTWLFEPLDGDETLDVGRMVGWRPVRPRSA